MKKLSQILVIMLLFIAGVAKAQSDVYEYATVVAVSDKPQIHVSFSNGTYKVIDTEKNDTKPNIFVNTDDSVEILSPNGK